MKSWRSLILKCFPNEWIKEVADICDQVLNRLTPLSINPPLPKNICIDPSTSCNLSCPLCPTGLKELGLRKQFMDFGTFRTVIDKIPSMRYLSMFNWGEPFLNPDIFKMIRYAKEKGITVGIHSNFNFHKNEKFFQDIADSGLDKLIVSCDGISTESYNKYRKGGDFKLVYENICRLKSHIKTTPKLIWQIIVSRYNEHEVAKIARLAKKLEIEWWAKPLRLGFDMCADWELRDSPQDQKKYWLPHNRKYVDRTYLKENLRPYRSGICFDLFRTVVINPDGTVQPCCGITQSENCFGDLRKQSFEDIWYGEKYRSARALFLKNIEKNTVETICYCCNLYRCRTEARPDKQEKKI